MKTLGELYNYTNDILLQGELSGIGDVIEFYEKAQQIIALRDPIEAKATISLTTNAFTIPVDCQELRKIKVDYNGDIIEVTPVEIWGNEVTLKPEYAAGNAYLYYHKKPAELNKLNVDQVPDIDKRYLPQMAEYAAKMYYMVDDDSDMSDAYTTSFFDTLTYYNKLNNNNKTYNIRNVW